MSLTVPRPLFPNGKRRAACLIGLCVLVFTLSGQASVRQGNLLEQARTKLEANHYVEAEELVRQFLGAEPDHAEAYYLLGVVLSKHEQWVEAGQALERSIELNPHYVVAHVQLAGVRHRQDARPEAMRHLRRAIALDPENTYAREFLGGLAYLEDRQLEALYHWNAVGKPSIHEISYLTPSQASPQFIGRLFRLNEGEVLRREQLMDIRWVRERLRLKTDFHWVLKPFSGDKWDLEISVGPQNTISSGKSLLLENVPRIVFNQEVFAEFQNNRGQSFGGGVRWDRQRKQVMARSSFPFLLSGSGVLRLGGDSREEMWRHTESGSEFDLQTAGLSGTYEHCFRRRKALSFHAAYRYQEFQFDQGTFPVQSPHVVALGLEWNQRIALNAEDERWLHWETRVDQIGLFGEGRQDTYRLATGVRVKWALRKKPRAHLVLSLRGGIAGDLLPLDEYFSLGAGPDNPLPLRAHPTLLDGRRGNNPLGREFGLANLEFVHRLFQWSFFEVDGLLFSDLAFVDRAPFGLLESRWLHDVGGGLRLRAFGQDIVHLVLGWDLKTGSFNQWTGLPSRE